MLNYLLDWPWFQTELDIAKSEIQKWISSFQNENFIPAGASPGLLNSEICSFLFILYDLLILKTIDLSM